MRFEGVKTGLGVFDILYAVLAGLYESTILFGGACVVESALVE